jgi:ABC-type dipeptide/oligopeptide/nickel transport system ATPase subunit
VQEQWQGYEVKTEGDAFMVRESLVQPRRAPHSMQTAQVAFQDPVNAVNWCLDVQQALLQAPWPEQLYNHKKSQIVRSQTDRVLFQGEKNTDVLRTRFVD